MTNSKKLNMIRAFINMYISNRERLNRCLDSEYIRPDEVEPIVNNMEGLETETLKLIYDILEVDKPGTVSSFLSNAHLEYSTTVTVVGYGNVFVKATEYGKLLLNKTFTDDICNLKVNRVSIINFKPSKNEDYIPCLQIEVI